MKHTHFLGIDPGVAGAIALISASGETAQVWPMPVLDRKGVKELDKHLLCDRLEHLRRLPAPVAGLEWPNTYKGSFGDVVRHAEVFGRQKGTLDAFLFGLGFDYRHVSPSAWKGKLGLPGKDWDPVSQQGADLWGRLYPQHSGLIRGPRGGLLDGPLDALLIAHYVKMSHTGAGSKGGRKPPTFRVLGMDTPLADWWAELKVPPV